MIKSRRKGVSIEKKKKKSKIGYNSPGNNVKKLRGLIKHRYDSKAKYEQIPIKKITVRNSMIF